MSDDDKLDKVTLIMVGPTILDEVEAPDKDVILEPCIHCEKNAWIPSSYEKKKSNGVDIQCWCLECYEEHRHDKKYGGKGVLKLDVQKLASDENADEVLDKIVNSSSKSELLDNLKEIKSKNEEHKKNSYLKFLKSSEQNYASLMEGLPALVSTAIASLRPWDNLQDLSVCVAIKITIDRILIDRHEVYGEENIWGDWDEQEIKLISMFGSAVVKAQDDSTRCIGGIIDLVEEDNSPLSQELNRIAGDKFNEGLEYFSERMDDDSWGFDYEEIDEVREFNEKQKEWESWGDSGQNEWESESEDDDWSEGQW